MDRIRDVARAWFGDDEIQSIIREFALGIQVIRLYECGYEETINDFSAAELLLMSTMALEHQKHVLMDAALAKADPRLLTMLGKAGLLEKETA